MNYLFAGLALVALVILWFGIRDFRRAFCPDSGPEPTPAELPVPGETWGYESSSLRLKGSPWEESTIHKPTIATIRVVQDGWVRYYFGHGDHPEDDLARSLKEFLRMYRRWPLS